VVVTLPVIIARDWVKYQFQEYILLEKAFHKIYGNFEERLTYNSQGPLNLLPDQVKFG